MIDNEECRMHFAFCIDYTASQILKLVSGEKLNDSRALQFKTLQRFPSLCIMHSAFYIKKTRRTISPSAENHSKILSVILYRGNDA